MNNKERGIRVLGEQERFLSNKNAALPNDSKVFTDISRNPFEYLNGLDTVNTHKCFNNGDLKIFVTVTGPWRLFAVSTVT